MSSLSIFVRKNIDPKVYFTATVKQIEWPASGAEGRTLCLFHGDKNTPSLSLNPDNGKWYCHGCGKGGKSIVSFHAALKQVTTEDAAKDLYGRYIRPVIEEKSIRKWRRNLRRCPSARRYIRSRHISSKFARAYELGFNRDQIVFPIRNEFGLCVDAKFYSPLANSNPKIPKMQHFRREEESRSYGSPTTLYPMAAFDKAKKTGFIVVTEGEWDALLLNSLGIPAVTATNGCKSWPKDCAKLFLGLEVYICYDNDKDGLKYSSKPIRSLRNVASKIYRVKVPQLPMGGKKKKKTKDPTDLFRIDERYQSKKGWLRFLSKSKLVLKNANLSLTGIDDDGGIESVSLDKAADAKYFKKVIKVDGLITGKANSPYMVPYKARITCSKECDNCPLAGSDDEHKEVKIDPTDPGVLKMIDANDTAVKRFILAAAGMTPSPLCDQRIEVTQSSNLEQVFLIPTLDNKQAEYCIRDAYCVGHGLKSNRSYRFQGITVPHPEDQRTTHLFSKAAPSQDEIDMFSLDAKTAEKLKIFRPRNLGVMATLMNISEWQSRNVTKITERQDLHIAVDLAYHSVREFDFNREHVKRGMLDVLIVGDTRCGKGYVAERIMQYYRLGEIGSGEMCSFAGLFGGVQTVGRRFVVTWGLIPLNHNRLVIIDEMSALSEAEIGKMSRVRSEGIAEINKIVRESTQANTRLIWLSNTRSGREMQGGHNNGVQVIKELIGANEDIARFDFAVSVATNEVDSTLINQVATEAQKDADLFPADLCRTLVLWAWSRDRNQIVFTEQALKEVIQQAIQFGRRYSSKVPLIQAENIRIKLAKVSAAIAARVFSSSEDYKRLIVKREHVRCACEFLRMIYSKPSMGYDVFSRAAIESSTVHNVGAIKTLFDSMGPAKEDTRKGLLDIHKITADTLADYVGDVQAAKGLIGDLVRLHCLGRIENGGWYLKNPSFTQWLRSSNGTTHHRNSRG